MPLLPFMFKTREDLAKYSVEYFLAHHQIPQISPDQVAANLKQIVPCFVTIYVSKDLRGCIGNYQSSDPLYKNIIKNAVSAAFSDLRFRPIDSSDLPNLTIEVSCLTPSVAYHPRSIAQLLNHLNTRKPGLIISSGFQKALFLPQVWEDLPNPRQFLSRLCLKAGLPENAWQQVDQVSFQTFTIF
jgi:AmmeMemoRadiSam system protein A